MGVLSAAGGRGAEPTEPEDQTPAPAGDDPTPADEGRARAEDGTFVKAADLQPVKPSRRDRARADVEETVKSHLSEYEKRQAAERQAYEQRLSAAEQRWQQSQEALARTQGALEEMRSRPAAAAAPAAPQGPDPEELRRQGAKELAAGNFDEWRRLEAQAMRIDARKEAEGIFRPQFEAFKAEMSKQIQPTMPPHIQSLLMRHQNVAMAGQEGIQAVIAEKQRLDVYRRDLTPQQREVMAFAVADKTLAAMTSSNGRPAGFDQSAAVALSSVPSARGAGGGSGAADDASGVQLSKLQEETWRKAGFSSAAEYVKYGDPHRYGLVRD